MPHNQFNSLHDASDSFYSAFQAGSDPVYDFQQSTIRSTAMALVLSIPKMGLGGMQWLVLQKVVAALRDLRNNLSLYPSTWSCSRLV